MTIESAPKTPLSLAVSPLTKTIYAVRGNRREDITKEFHRFVDPLVIDFKARAEKAEAERENYRNVLIGMGFQNLDSLATEIRDTTQIGTAATQRIIEKDQRIIDLSAENERLREALEKISRADEYAVPNSSPSDADLIDAAELARQALRGES